MSDPHKHPSAAPPTPATPAASPPKPPPTSAPAAAKKGEDRRFFLFTWVGAAWATFTATMVAWTFGTIRFMYPNVLSEPPSTFKAGLPSSIERGQVVERFKQDKGVWIVREGNTVFAISTICTHLGCTPNWLEAEQKFKCPCHGSGFYKTGVNFEGPAPRPLERYKISIAEDGQILVDKSRKFLFELGEWGNPEASVQVV
jgi:cytochrome b6-f complex iron-sulfur subunit